MQEFQQPALLMTEVTVLAVTTMMMTALTSFYDVSECFDMSWSIG